MTLLTIPIAILFPLGPKILENEQAKFWFYVALLMILGFVSAFSQAAVYGQASCFPSHDQLASLCIGLGLSGVMMNLFEGVLIYIRIYIQKSSDSSSFESTLIFWIVAAVLQLITASLFFVERNNKFAKFFYRKQMIYNEKQPRIGLFEQAKNVILGCSGSWFYICTLSFTFICTFAVFPGVTNHAPLSFIDKDGPWFQLIFITLFNILDTVGRTIGGKIDLSDRSMTAWSIFRLLQVVLFIVVGLFAQDSFNGTGGDILKLSNFIIFSMGNGVLQTIAIIKAPMHCRPNCQEKVGMMINFSLNFGIMAGSIIQVCMQRFA